MVNVPALYSDDPSSNPAEVGNFSAKIVFEKDKFDRKEAGVGPICKNNEKSTLNDDPHAWKHSLLFFHHLLLELTGAISGRFYVTHRRSFVRSLVQDAK